jgi:hypothetical protein
LESPSANPESPPRRRFRGLAGQDSSNEKKK